jgi:hypothetical protein
VNREQLAHILRSAATIVDDPNILVIGSQSVLATFDEDELPDAATASMELDLAYFDDPTDDKADAVDGAIGELSPFHEMNGVYAQGVSVRTAVLPEGWRGRVVPWSNQSTGRARAAFLEPHDCVVSKLVAYREKDFAFAAAMMEHGLIDPLVVAGRIDLLPTSLDLRVKARLHSWLNAWVDRHRPG